MTEWDHLSRRSLFWLFMPVMVAFWAGDAHGGLAIGLTDSAADHSYQATASCLPDSDEEGKSWIDSRNGQMNCSPAGQQDNVEQYADAINSLGLRPVASRMSPVWSRVVPLHVAPPPLIIPISSN